MTSEGTGIRIHNSEFILVELLVLRLQTLIELLRGRNAQVIVEEIGNFDIAGGALLYHL